MAEEVQDGLPIPFFPASLDQPERNSPQLPQGFPQLPNNASPVEIADEVTLEPSFHALLN